MRARFPDDDAEPTAEDRAAMRDIASGGTGEVASSQIRVWTNEERVLGIVGDGFPYRDVLRLIEALGEAEERGRASAGATRDELAAARARLEDAEARRRRDLENADELRALLLRGAEAGTADLRARLENAERELATYVGNLARVEKEANRRIQAAQSAGPAGDAGKLRDELAFARGQIDTFHADIVKLQGELAAALAESNRASLALADAQEEAKRAKASARRRRRKL